MRLAKKLLIVLVSILALLFLIAIVVRVAILPNLIENQLKLALQKSGLSDVSVEVQGATFGAASLRNLTIGKEGRVTIEDVKIGYNPASVAKGRLEELLLSNARFDLKIQEGAIDWGPISNITGGSETDLPFERLEIRESVLGIDLEDSEIQIPWQAVLENLGDGNCKIDLHASLHDASIDLNAAIDINSIDGEGEITITELDIGYLIEMLPLENLGLDGILNLNSHFAIEKRQVQAEARLSSDRMTLKPGGILGELEFALTSVKARVSYASDGIAKIDLGAYLNESPLALTSNINIKSLNGVHDLSIDRLDAGILERIYSHYLPDQEVDFEGGFAVTARITAENDQAGVHFTLKTDQLSMITEIDSHDVSLFPAEIKGRVSFIRDAGEFGISDGILRVGGMKIANNSLGITMENLSCILPFSRAEQRIEDGEFSLNSVLLGGHELKNISGSFTARDGQIVMIAEGQLLPEAGVELSGSVDWKQNDPSGELRVQIPRFNLVNGELLTNNLFPNNFDRIGGSFSMDAVIKYDDHKLKPFIRLSMDDATFINSESDFGAQGVAGVITLNGLFPPSTSGEQRLVIAAAHKGTFRPVNGQMRFQVWNLDSILVNSIEFEWLGGKMSASDIDIRPFESRVSLDLHADGLDLQDILDFMEYDGVMGVGKIYGHLPMTISWGQQSRISFGDGFFEARPNKGRLQISEDNARAILGITEDIDPKKADLEKTVSLMVLQALQDMEYSKLRIDFANEESGWMTRVQAEGYGPRGAKENRVPIGGLNVNINNFDELLNSIIFSKVGSGKAEFD